MRISVSEVNFGGYYGGGIPPWWSSTSPAQAFIHAVQVFAGTGTPAQVAGSGLTPLTTGSTAPATPTGLVATAGNAQVALTWTAVPGATSYDVYRERQLDRLGHLGLGHGHRTDQRHRVQLHGLGLRRRRYVGPSRRRWLATLSMRSPSLPRALTASAVTADGATLAWAASAGATGYTVFANGTEVATSTTTSAVVTDLNAGHPLQLVGDGVRRRRNVGAVRRRSPSSPCPGRRPSR